MTTGKNTDVALAKATDGRDDFGLEPKKTGTPLTIEQKATRELLLPPGRMRSSGDAAVARRIPSWARTSES